MFLKNFFLKSFLYAVFKTKTPKKIQDKINIIVGAGELSRKKLI